MRHLTSAVLLMALSCACCADIVPIGPFTGEVSETFNQYTSVQAEQSLPVFSGLGELENLSVDGAIKVEWASLFLGHQVAAISGMMGGQLGIAQWVFDKPVSRFGGMWENDSGQHDATIDFYDAEGNLIGSVVGDIPFASGWTWNGWESDTPFTRVVVTGNGVVNGFLWYENMQIVLAPQGPPGDLNGDGMVNVTDLLLMLGEWGACADCAPGNCPADLDGDCSVNVSDLLELLANWG